MINFKTTDLATCEKCLHKKVCKNKDNTKIYKEKTIDALYGFDLNDNYDIATDHFLVDVLFQCTDYSLDEYSLEKENKND